jgi:hypothetical protein
MWFYSPTANALGLCEVSKSDLAKRGFFDILQKKHIKQLIINEIVKDVALKKDKIGQGSKSTLASKLLSIKPKLLRYIGR